MTGITRVCRPVADSRARRVRSVRWSSRAALALAAAGCVVFVPDPCWAQSAPPTSPPTDSGEDEYVHGGTYARLTLGGAALMGTFDDAEIRDGDRDLDGQAIGVDAHLGTAPVPGFALGFMLTYLVAPSVHYERDGAGSDGSLSSAQLGVFLDGFPWPRAGLHLGTAVGFAFVELRDIELQFKELQRDDVATSGLGLSLWTGYDFWVASDWSLGPMLRGTSTFTGGGSRYRATVTLLTLGVSVLYQ